MIKYTNLLYASKNSILSNLFPCLFSIFDECLKDSGETDKEMKQTLLSQLVAQPGSTKRFNNRLNISSMVKRNGGGGIFMPNLKTKLKGKDKVYDKKDMK